MLEMYRSGVSVLVFGVIMLVLVAEQIPALLRYELHIKTVQLVATVLGPIALIAYLGGMTVNEFFWDAKESPRRILPISLKFLRDICISLVIALFGTITIVLVGGTALIQIWEEEENPLKGIQYGGA